MANFGTMPILLVAMTKVYSGTTALGVTLLVGKWNMRRYVRLRLVQFSLLVLVMVVTLGVYLVYCSNMCAVAAE